MVSRDVEYSTLREYMERRCRHAASLWLQNAAQQLADEAHATALLQGWSDLELETFFRELYAAFVAVRGSTWCSFNVISSKEMSHLLCNRARRRAESCCGASHARRKRTRLPGCVQHMNSLIEEWQNVGMRLRLTQATPI